MARRDTAIPEPFHHRFTVTEDAPFRRHLNRLEVEIGKEDYSHLKQVELLDGTLHEANFAAMEELTARLLKTTQNGYNRELLLRLGIRIYLDAPLYDVYYRLPDRIVRFRPAWRQQLLRSFFGETPVADTLWRPGDPRLPGFAARFLPDEAGGVLLLRRSAGCAGRRPLLTATHGPYDPHTCDAALYLLRRGAAEAALINLGFSGREPLTDENLEKLKGWGIPLNPSSIDVIYPYAAAGGHPYCYKLEERLAHYVARLGIPAPRLIIDLHGCVGTAPEDERLVVGLGGLPPYPAPATLGRMEETTTGLRLCPGPNLARGLALLRGLSPQVCLQFCSGPHEGYHFALHGTQLCGRRLDPRTELRSLLAGEPRFYLPAEQSRWLPGAGGNALQRLAAGRLRPGALCLHVEMPTAVRRRLALALSEEETAASFTASSL